ncbi:uncharacterized protein BDV17DRAFT_301381 [Aspergillus undulatus]|uniref:uncharacterized protein n=1 Tax=Aspergillus undulatus TaxID=1810928 RepID=UPI003CCE1E8E
MDSYLRCNSLQCRASLKDRAVVTTCSHIFCIQCAESSGLTRYGDERPCPACNMALLNPDDAVSTVLQPTEDYKTSVLSGLDPNTIMECTGRALKFWAYQMTQETVYQEVLGKTLKDKYANLNTQMDKVIHNANKDISTLQKRLNAPDMQTAQELLRKENQRLANMCREKCKKFTQITHLYNVLKSRAMRSQMQTAAASRAMNSLDAPRNGPVNPALQDLGASMPPQTPSAYQQRAYSVDLGGVEQLHRHQRSGTGSSKGRKQKDANAMPPPSRPVLGLRSGEPPNATPKHRMRLAPSRPSTGMSQLPNDSIMLERFHANQPPTEGYMDGRHHPPTHREALNVQSYRPTDGAPGIASFFNSTLS